MVIKRLEFINYRNLENSFIIPKEGINVIIGNNAQGKTNLVECLWLFTGGRSFRGAKESELIAFGQKEALIKVYFFAEGRDQTIELSIKNGKRQSVLNDVPKRYLSQIIGTFCAVVFSPDHLTLIKGGPDERRSFIDGALCQIKPSYATLLTRYKRILGERNALLKDIPKHRELEDTLDIWNEKLANEGAAVAVQRAAYVERLRTHAAAFYDGISGGKEKLDINYRISFRAENGQSAEKIAEKLLSSLKKKQKDDIYLGYTTAGPHRDDLLITIDGKEAKSFGSQGQQRSAVLSMKLAEAAVLGEFKREAPIVLLDDVLSELDPFRQDYLLKRLGGMQVFITCCELNTPAQSVITIEKGRITQAENKTEED